VRSATAGRHACAPRGCTDSSSGSVARPVHASWPAPVHASWPAPVHGSWPARRSLVCLDASDAGCAARVQRLEPLIALMLIRQRLPLMDATGGGQHTALGPAVTALPSGLLAMVCEAILKLESKLDVRASFSGLCAAWPHCTPHATSSPFGSKRTLHDRRCLCACMFHGCVRMDMRVRMCGVGRAVHAVLAWHGAAAVPRCECVRSDRR
jgi:hypothetical protein